MVPRYRPPPICALGAELGAELATSGTEVQRKLIGKLGSESAVWLPTVV